MCGSPELRLLLPTDFSAQSQVAVRAALQLAEACRVALTIVHVLPPGSRPQRARASLDAVLPDTAPLQHCDRLLLEAPDPAVAIGELCQKERFDLVMAPSSGRRLPGLFSSSFRAGLLRRCHVPVWTGAGRLPIERFARPISTVACLIDFDDEPGRFLRRVSAFTSHLGARLQLLSVLRPVDDGTIGDVVTSDAPLSPVHAVDRVRALFAGQACPEFDVAVGDLRPTLGAMLARCEADLLFVGPRQSRSGGWRTRLPRLFDRLPCPVVCLDGRSVGAVEWSFEDAVPYLADADAHRAVVVAG